MQLACELHQRQFWVRSETCCVLTIQLPAHLLQYPQFVFQRHFWCNLLFNDLNESPNWRNVFFTFIVFGWETLDRHHAIQLHYLKQSHSRSPRFAIEICRNSHSVECDQGSKSQRVLWLDANRNIRQDQRSIQSQCVDTISFQCKSRTHITILHSNRRDSLY